MRIYITSRNRTHSSASPSDFQFALERPLDLPEGARGAVDSFTCSNVWEAVLAGENQTLDCKYNFAAQQALVLTMGDLVSVADLASKLSTGLATLNPGLPPVTVAASGNRLLFSRPSLGVGETFTVSSRATVNSGLSAYTQPSGGWVMLQLWSGP